MEIYKNFRSPAGGGEVRSRDSGAIFAESGASYLCGRKNRPRFTPQILNMANQKTNRREHSQTAPTERPGNATPCSIVAASLAVCVKGVAERQAVGVAKECRVYALRLDMERPQNGERFQSGRQRRRCPSRPEVKPLSRRCTPIYPQNGKWKMPTADAMPYSPAVGTSARAKVKCKMRE